MVKLNEITQLINGRPVIVMLHGKSIEGLEQIITELKDIDICYVSLNYFDLMEKEILSKIGEHLDFVYDSSTTPPNYTQPYETQVRIPRLSKFLDRQENNLWITTQGLMNVIMFDTNNEYFIEKYQHKIFLIDSLSIRLNVPNSAVLLIGMALLGRARKIAICGMDGHSGKRETTLETYYKPELFKKHCSSALGNKTPTEVARDTSAFNTELKGIINDYACRYNVGLPPIVDCSPYNNYNMFDKLKYNQLKEWISVI